MQMKECSLRLLTSFSKMKLLTRPIVSGRRLDRTQTPFSHMHSHVLVEQSGARERACAVSTSKRSFVNVCFHVCAVLHWM